MPCGDCERCLVGEKKTTNQKVISVSIAFMLKCKRTLKSVWMKFKNFGYFFFLLLLFVNQTLEIKQSTKCYAAQKGSNLFIEFFVKWFFHKKKNNSQNYYWKTNILFTLMHSASIVECVFHFNSIHSILISVIGFLLINIVHGSAFNWLQHASVWLNESMCTESELCAILKSLFVRYVLLCIHMTCQF